MSPNLSSESIALLLGFKNEYEEYIEARMRILASPNVIELVRYALNQRLYAAALEIIKHLEPERLKAIFHELLSASVGDLGYVSWFRDAIRSIDHEWLKQHLAEGIKVTIEKERLQNDLFYVYPLLFAVAENIDVEAQNYIVDHALSSQNPDFVEIGEGLAERLAAQRQNNH